jgi:hypothetical protein
MYLEGEMALLSAERSHVTQQPLNDNEDMRSESLHY